MPLGKGFYGSNSDGTDNHAFCVYCFRDGKYTEPRITRDEMVEKSVGHMMSELKLDREKAEELALEMIPTLLRWQ